MKIRIKTEEEFIKEFGDGWRCVGVKNFYLPINFLNEMNIYLGKIIELTKKQIEQIENNGYFYIYSPYSCFIWKHMFVEVDENNKEINFNCFNSLNDEYINIR